MKKWLTRNHCWTKDGEKTTHTFMDGGKFTIPVDKLESFYQIYSESVRAKEYLTIIEQRSRPTFNFFLDVDFLDDKPMDDDMCDYLCRFCRSVISDRDNIIVCMSKPKIKNDLIKTGIHIHWNHVVHEDDVDQYIRKITTAMAKKYPDYNWNDIIDTSVYRGGGLRMKWSHKYENKKYTVPYVPVLEFSHKQNEKRMIPQGISNWMMEQTSIRDVHVTPPTIEEQVKNKFTKTDVAHRTEASSELENWIRHNMQGQQNAIVKCLYVHPTCILVNTTSHFCEIKGCPHVSNHVYFHIDLKKNKISQKCWDEKCKMKGKSGQGMLYDIPLQLIIDYKPKKLEFLNNDTTTIIMEQFYKKATKYK